MAASSPSKLARYGKVGGLPKEVLGIVHRPLFGAWGIVNIERSYLEHLARTFGIGAGDDGGVEVVEAPLVEVVVNGVCHLVTDTEHGTKGIGAWAEMCNFAQELHGVPFLLEGVGVGVGSAVEQDIGGLNFHALPFALRFHQPARYA